MAEWRAFNASNDQRTCLWCGRKLRYLTKQDWPVDQSKPTKTYKAVLAGDYEDGYFCGLRCAYQFALRMAQLGRRLIPQEEKHAQTQ
jgi:hypothetical protein